MTQRTFIYALAHPKTGEIRYVGKSINPSARLRAHIGSARRSEYQHHTSRWIRTLLDAGLEPVLIVLTEVPKGADWREVERKYVADFEAEGVRLTNSTAGGEGLDYRDPEDRARYIANLTVAMAAYRKTPEGIASMARMFAAAHTPEARRKRSEALKSFYEDPENRERCAATNREILSRPEVKAKRSQASTAMWQSPETREKLMTAFANPDVKEKQSEAKRKAWADPVKGKNLRDAAASPTRRAKSSAAAIARATPEYREQFSNITASGWADPEKRAARQAGIDALKADPARNAARKEKMSEKSALAWSDPEAKARRLEKMRDPEIVERKKAGLRAKWADPEWRAQREENAARRKAEKLAQTNQA